MPLTQPGIAQSGGDLNNDLQKRINQLSTQIQENILTKLHANDIQRSEVRLLKPLHLCAMVTDNTVFVVLATHELGGISTRNYLDFAGKPMNITTTIYLAERDLQFEDAFAFAFPRSVLSQNDDELGSSVDRITDELLRLEIAHIERLNRMVRINPIFAGREFMVDEGLVFVFSPFEEPFDTIYVDHIRTTIETVDDMRCLRADNIYDNKPIMEDVWRCTNEARIILAELTNRNPNVFYETGITHTIGKEVILLTQSMNDVPFDLQHLRCIVYEYTPRGMENFEQQLKNTVRNVLTRSN